MSDSNDLKKTTITGVSLRKQLIGGYRKTDVIEYIEKLNTLLETERSAFAAEKEKLYSLMKHGQEFCDSLMLETQQKADLLMQQTQQENDKRIDQAKLKLEEIQIECDQLIKKTQEDAYALICMITRQREEADQVYEQLLRSVKTLSDPQ